VPTTSFHTDKIRDYPDGQIFGHRHQRLGPDAVLPMADFSGRPMGDHRPTCVSSRASAPKPSRGERRHDAQGSQDRRRCRAPRSWRSSHVRVAVTWSASTEYNEPSRVAAGLSRRDAAPAGARGRACRARKEGCGPPLRRGRVPGIPQDRQPRGDLDRRQLHLLFAAFVLAVPIFALIIEFIGYKTKDKRYDKLAYEFTKLLSVSFSLTATFGRR
jgi:hypothetical protein